MSKHVQINIGDVTISILGDLNCKITPTYRPFVEKGKTDINLRLHHLVPTIPNGEKVFECPPIWALYRQNGTSIIKIFATLSGLQRTLILSPYLEKADLYFAGSSGRFMDPFFGPTMELLLLNYLATAKGVILHACGVAKNGRGILFVGESGAGKSTLAKMWTQEHGVDILSDDRIVLRQEGDAYRMYGTPWHGEAKFGSPQKAQLEYIFFLRHGQKNSVKETGGSDPLSRLLTCSFPPLWDRRGMECVLDLFTNLTADVSCRELAFKPRKSVLDLVKKITKW